MTSKEELHLMLEFTYDEPLDKTSAWSCYERFQEHLSNGDILTIKYFLQVINYDHEMVLKFRTKFSELGYELTPDQASQYIFILATCIIDRITGNTKNAKQS